MQTTYEIAGTVTGGLWWPIGAPAGKDVRYRFTREPDADPWVDEAPDLTAAVDALTLREGGDFSTAARMTADSVLIVTRTTRPGFTHRRVMALACFRSIAEYVTDELYASDFDHTDYPDCHDHDTTDGAE